MLRKNNCNNIEFIQTDSKELILPEPVDIIVSDLRGALPLYQNHIQTLIDAKKRFLKNDGVLLPKQDSLWVGVCSNEDLLNKCLKPWGQDELGLNFKSLEKIFSNSWISTSINTDELISSKKNWANIDYSNSSDIDFSGEVQCQINKDSTGHGLFIWFDTLIADDIGFSCGPGQENKVYGSAFFPWKEPVELSSGDLISIQIEAKLIAEDYIWNWKSHIRPNTSNEKKFAQSSFFSQMIKPKDLNV